MLNKVNVNLSFKTIFADFFGGLASMLVAFPSAIAFGLLVYSPLGSSAAGQGAIAGIIGAILIGIIAPSFGGAPRLISAPCGPSAAVLSAFVAEIFAMNDFDVSMVPLFIMMVVVLAGSFQFIFGILGSGKLIKYVPYSVVAGYLSSVGILIFIGQLPKLLGTPKDTTFFTMIMSPSLWNTPSLIIGICTIITMLVAPRLTRILPSVILAVCVGILSYFVLGMTRYPDLLTLQNNHLVIGSLNNVTVDKHFFEILPEQWINGGKNLIHHFSLVFMPALSLALLLSIDTLKTCVVLDTLTRSRHRSNQELIAQGMANISAGLFGGIAGSAMMGATLVNLTSGGISRLSGVFTGLLSLLTFVILGNLVAWVPIPALAGILVVVGLRMIDKSSLKLMLNKSTLLDFLVIFSVVISAVTTTLITATIVGIGFAILLFLREQIGSPVIRNRATGNQLFSKSKRLPEAINILQENGKSIVIFQLQGNLFFGTTDQLINELQEPLINAKYLILDFKHVKSLDFTAVHMLQQVEDTLTERGAWLLFSDLPFALPTGQDVKSYLNDAGLVRESGNLKIFADLNEAMEWAEDNLLVSCGYEFPQSAPPLELDEINTFSDLDAQSIKLLQQHIKSASFETNEKLFSCGDSADTIYFIRRGQVKILLPINKHKTRLLMSVGRGDFLGEIVFLSGGVRTADAVAVKPTDVYILSKDDLDAILINHPEIGAKIYERMSRTLAFRLKLADYEISVLEQR